MAVVALAATTNPVKFAVSRLPTIGRIGTPTILDIELVQVLHLLCGVGMQIIAMDPVLIMLVVLHAAVKLVAGGTLVDIESLLPLMFEEGVLLADHLVELLMDLHLVQGLGWVEIIQMFDQGKETGSAQILCVPT